MLSTPFRFATSFGTRRAALGVMMPGYQMKLATFLDSNEPLTPWNQLPGAPPRAGIDCGKVRFPFSHRIPAPIPTVFPSVRTLSG